MPQYNWQKPRSQTPVPLKKAAPIISDPRCKVCASPHRKLIDELLARGITFTELERNFGVPRRSCANHREKHLDFDAAGIRHIIEKEAEAAQKSFETGVERAVTKAAFLEVGVQKAFDKLINDELEMSVGEMVKLIELKDKLETRNESAALDELRFQFQAFMQSVKEIVPTEFWERVVMRTHEIAKASGREPPMVTEAKELPKVIETEVVDEDSSSSNGRPDK